MKVIPCYCGGFVVFRKKIDRRFKQGWKWEIWNCFPTNPMEGE